MADRDSDSCCNIARSLAVVGDKWTLLIMREISLGVRRFEEIQAQTGMSSHILAARLKRLEEDGIVERRVYNAKPLRHEYHATPKGKDLDEILLALRSWDLRWRTEAANEPPAVKLIDKKSGQEIESAWSNPEGVPFSFAFCQSIMSDRWRAEREAKVADFYNAKLDTKPFAKSAKQSSKSVSKPASTQTSKKMKPSLNSKSSASKR